MSLPARRMYDVWADPDYDFAETKAERLLLAGLDYSIQKYVVYVAAKPPRSVFRNVAARFGRTIVYIPIGQLSPVTMKKIRVVHVLDGYDKRDERERLHLVTVAGDAHWPPRISGHADLPMSRELPFEAGGATIWAWHRWYMAWIRPTTKRSPNWSAKQDRIISIVRWRTSLTSWRTFRNSTAPSWGRVRSTGKLKEMVYLAVSTVNECKYCTAAHLKGARKAGLSERDIEDIESETNQNFSPAEQTALHYAREMTRACADEFDTREQLREYFSEEQLVELTLVIAMANFTNRFNNGLNVQVENEPKR